MKKYVDCDDYHTLAAQLQQCTQMSKPINSNAVRMSTQSWHRMWATNSIATEIAINYCMIDNHMFNCDGVCNEPLHVQPRWRSWQTIKSSNARVNKAQQSKRGDSHGRLNWSRRLINFRFTRVNNRNNTWRQGSPKGTKEEQQSTCWWLLSCFPFGLSARIPALAVLKKVCQVWMDSTINQIGFWQWSHDHYQKMKTISLMATLSHCNNVFLDDWFINQHCSKKRNLEQTAWWWFA